MNYNDLLTTTGFGTSTSITLNPGSTINYENPKTINYENPKTIEEKTKKSVKELSKKLKHEQKKLQTIKRLQELGIDIETLKEVLK